MHNSALVWLGTWPSVMQLGCQLLEAMEAAFTLAHSLLQCLMFQQKSQHKAPFSEYHRQWLLL